MSERLELSVDFQTQQGVEAVQRFLAVMDQLDGKMTGATRQFEQSEAGLRDMAMTTEQAAASMKLLSNNAEKAGTAAQEASRKASTGAEETEKYTNRVADSVKNWALSYFGLQGALELLAKMEEKMKAIAQAQRDLVQQRWDSAHVEEFIIGNLGITNGPAGSASQQAQGLINSMMFPAGQNPTGADRPTAAAAIVAGNSVGFDPRTDKGREAVTANVRYAARLNLNDDEQMQLAKMEQQLGMRSAGEITKLQSQIFANFRAAGVGTEGQFLRGLLESVGTENAKGVPIENSMSYYTAETKTTRNTRRAADHVRELYDLASSTDQKTREFMAHQAASLGVTHPDAVGDDAVSQFIASDTSTESQQARRSQDRLGELAERQKGIYVRGRHAGRHVSESRISAEVNALQNFDPAAAVAELHDHNVQAADELTRTIVEGKEITDAANSQRAKIRGKLQARGEMEAWEGVSVNDRVERVVVPMFQGAKSVEERNRLRDSLGGLSAASDVASVMSTPANQTAIAEARSATKAAQPDEITQVNREFLERPMAQNAIAEARRQQSNIGAVNEGMEFSKRLEDDTDEELKRVRTSENWTPGDEWTVGTDGDVNWSDEDGMKSHVARRRLARIVIGFYNSITPQERKESGLTTWIPRMLHDLFYAQGMRKGSWILNSVRKWAKEFGEIRGKILAARHQRGDTSLDNTTVPDETKASLNTDPDITGDSLLLMDPDDPASVKRRELSPDQPFTPGTRRGEGATDPQPWSPAAPVPGSAHSAIPLPDQFADADPFSAAIGQAIAADKHNAENLAGVPGLPPKPGDYWDFVHREWREPTDENPDPNPAPILSGPGVARRLAASAGLMAAHAAAAKAKSPFHLGHGPPNLNGGPLNPYSGKHNPYPYAREPNVKDPAAATRHALEWQKELHSRGQDVDPDAVARAKMGAAVSDEAHELARFHILAGASASDARHHTIINNYVTNKPGNVWMGGGADIDMPGRLESHAAENH